METMRKSIIEGFIRSLRSLCEGANFTLRKKVYRKSNIFITKKIAEYSKWDAESIEDRQKWLAEFAIQAWPNVI